MGGGTFLSVIRKRLPAEMYVAVTVQGIRRCGLHQLTLQLAWAYEVEIPGDMEVRMKNEGGRDDCPVN